MPTKLSPAEPISDPCKDCDFYIDCDDLEKGKVACKMIGFEEGAGLK